MPDPAVGFWKRVAPAFDPFFQIPVDRVDKLYAPRHRGPADRLVRRVRGEVEPERLKVLLCGARGSGKTTELTRIAHDLYLEWSPLRVDLASILPPGSGTLTICVHVGAAALRALHDRKAPGTALEPGEWSAAGRFFAGALERFGAGVETVGKLMEAMASVSELIVPPGHLSPGVAPLVATTAGAALKVGGSQVRARVGAARAAVSGPLGAYVAPERMEDATSVLEGINAILAELREIEHRPVLILVEGLDKLTRLDDIRQAIAQPELLELIAAPLILTGPVQLRSSPEFSRLPGSLRPELMNNVPVLSPPFQKPHVHAEGVAELVELYERRRAAFELPPALVARPLVERAALMSSGIPREFLTILDLARQEAMSGGRAQIVPEDLDGALRERRLTLTGSYTEQRVRILYRVLQTGLPGDGPEADELLFTNFIAGYPNGELWYRPHELLVDSIRERGALLDQLGGARGED